MRVAHAGKLSHVSNRWQQWHGVGGTRWVLMSCGLNPVVRVRGQMESRQSEPQTHQKHSPNQFTFRQDNYYTCLCKACMMPITCPSISNNWKHLILVDFKNLLMLNYSYLPSNLPWEVLMSTSAQMFPFFLGIILYFLRLSSVLHHAFPISLYPRIFFFLIS